LARFLFSLFFFGKGRIPKRRIRRTYFSCCSNISNYCREFNILGDDSLEILSLGIAHDLIEDYGVGGQKFICDSFKNFNDSVVELMDFLDCCKTLTRKAGEQYFDYINRIISSGDSRALIVKLCDLEANISRATEDGSRLQKYLFAHEKIWSALKELERKERINKILKI
jgi:hypothetical protein